MISYLRFLYRNKLYTLINVLGLAISMMFVIIIAKFAKMEFTVDSFQENADDIYALATEDFVASAYGLTPYLTSRYPEIQSVCAVKGTGNQVVNIYDTDHTVSSLAVDTTFLKMFSFPLADGNRMTALDTKEKVIISEEFANMAFHDVQPVGKSILVKWSGGTSTNVEVGGVFKKIENSLFPSVDFIFNLQNYTEFIDENTKNDDLGNASGVTLFIQTFPGANLKEKEADMLEYFKEYYWIYRDGARKEVRIFNYNELYFNDLNYCAFYTNEGNITFIKILMAVAFFILLFALINYINLTVAQTGFRAKEMATRRLLGTSKNGVIMRMIAEAILLTIIAFVLGLLFAGLAEPVTQTLLGKDIDVFHNITFDEILVSIALILFVGVLAGLIPAMMISKFKPIDVVKGSFRLKSKLVFGKIFIMIQNVITITMLSLTIALSWQFNHLMNRPLNHKTHDIMEINIYYANNITEKLEMIKEELEKLPDVVEVGFTQGYPLGPCNNNIFELNGDLFSLKWLTCDTTAFKIFDFEVVTQNGEPLPDTWWLTEKAMRRYNLDYDVTEFVANTEWNWNIKVCGVIKDFNELSCGENDVFLINMLSEDSGKPWNTTIKTTSRHAKAIEEVKAKIKELANVDVECMYLDDYWAETYYKELKDVRKIVLIFSIVALIISTLGLIAMSTYYAKQRSKEVAVNKVFGSTNTEAFKRLTGGFLKMLLVSFVIAVPIAWFLIDYWLKDYSYKISISPLIFIAAGFIVLLIAALAISWQSVKAANANPVESLKKE